MEGVPPKAPPPQPLDEKAALQFVKDTDWAYWVTNDRVRGLLSQIRDALATSSSTRGNTSGSDTAATDAEKVAPLDDTKIKLVVVGDGAVGKTCLLVVFSTTKFPEEYTPTVFENFSTPMKYAGRELTLHLWDTAGQEEYDRLRPLSYPGTDVVLLCYSTVIQSSHQAISSKWAPEIRHYLPNVPTILVGLKTDLRDAGQKDPHATAFEPVSAEAGKDLAKKIGAACYMEASAKNNSGVREVFETAVQTVWNKRHPNNGGAAAGGSSSSSSSAAAASGNTTAGHSDSKPGKKTCTLL